MKLASVICGAVVIGGCSSLGVPMESSQRAPAGWQSYCFPIQIAFVSGTDQITPGTLRTIAPINEMHLSRHQWVQVVVSAGARPDSSAAALANRRAEAIVRMLAQLGHRQIQVDIHRSDFVRDDRDIGLRGGAASPDAGEAVSVDLAALVAAMIPPEQVEHLRILRERDNIVVC